MKNTTTTDSPKYYAVLEHIRYGEASVTLTDQNGEWAGCFLVQCRSGRTSDLYESGYIAASVSVRSKGGRLERYTEVRP